MRVFGEEGTMGVEVRWGRARASQWRRCRIVPVAAPKRRRRSRRAQAGVLVLGMLGAMAFASTVQPAARAAVATKGVVSPRLKALAKAQTQRLSARAQSQAVGLPAAGPFSLVKRPGGRY